MGLFSKLKQSMNGDVKVDLEIPATVKIGDASFDAKVTLNNNGTEAENISQVSVNLMREKHNVSPQGGGSNSFQERVSSANYTQPFQLQPGQSTPLTIKVPMNIGKLVEQNLEQGGALAKLASVASKAEEVADALNADNFSYYVEVFASIEGKHFGASHRANIQVLKPGQFGAGLNLHT